MYEITKEFTFSASHVLAGLPDGHPCGWLHGHNYIVRIHLASDRLNAVGFVRDYRDLDNVKRFLDSEWDHHHLNDIVSFNPTAELLAGYLYERFAPSLPELVAVSIAETPKTWATYRPA